MQEKEINKHRWAACAAAKRFDRSTARHGGRPLNATGKRCVRLEPRVCACVFSFYFTILFLLLQAIKIGLKRHC